MGAIKYTLCTLSYTLWVTKKNTYWVYGVDTIPYTLWVTKKNTLWVYVVGTLGYTLWITNLYTLWVTFGYPQRIPTTFNLLSTVYRLFPRAHNVYPQCIICCPQSIECTHNVKLYVLDNKLTVWVYVVGHTIYVVDIHSVYTFWIPIYNVCIRCVSLLIRRG